MSASELSGSWTHRSFNPTYVEADQTDQRELGLILAEGVFNLKTAISATALEGTFEWGGGGLDLTGTVQPGVGGEPAGFDIVGTGRPGTGTAGWEYRYHGYLTREWRNTVDQRPALVGSVIRVNPHASSDGGTSPGGAVYSFIAVKQQQPFTWELPGSWIYRSFHNWARYVYQTAPQIAQPSAHELILQDAVFKFEAQPVRPCEGRLSGMSATERIKRKAAASI